MSARGLVVLGSSLTALAVVRAARRSGFECVLLDDRRGPGAGTRMAEFQLLKGGGDDAWLLQIGELFRAGAALIADSDRWLRFLVRSGELLRAQGYRVLHPVAPVIETCLDKSRFLRWCAEQGLPAPKLYDRHEPGAGQFPVLLRPQETQHSVATGLPKAVEARGERELQEWRSRFAAAGVQPNVCQSLLRPGLRQYSVGAARNADGEVVTLLAEKLRPDAAQCAGGTFVGLAQHAGIEDLAAQALRRLDFFGVAEVEILCDPSTGEAWLVEINARPWLQFGLPYACGVDLLAHLTGVPPRTRPRSRRDHAWLYFHSDLYACFSRSSGMVRNGNLGLYDYVVSLVKADVHPVWDLADPMPFVHALAGRFRKPART